MSFTGQAIDHYARTNHGAFLFNSRNGRGPVLDDEAIRTAAGATHSLRRTKASLIYRQTVNMRAVQLPLGHNEIESVRVSFGVEFDDALAIAEPLSSKLRL